MNPCAHEPRNHERHFVPAFHRAARSPRPCRTREGHDVIVRDRDDPFLHPTRAGSLAAPAASLPLRATPRREQWLLAGVPIPTVPTIPCHRLRSFSSLSYPRRVSLAIVACDADGFGLASRPFGRYIIPALVPRVNTFGASEGCDFRRTFVRSARPVRVPLNGNRAVCSAPSRLAGEGYAPVPEGRVRPVRAKDDMV